MQNAYGVFLLHLALVWGGTRGEFSQTFWKRLPALDNLRFQNGGGRRAVAGGPSRCSVECSQDPSCAAFNVEVQTEQCFLIAQSANLLVHAVPAQGFRFYAPDQGLCDESAGLTRLPGPLCVQLVVSKVLGGQAFQDCRARGLQLVSLDSRQKMNTFKEYLILKGQQNEFAWFVGLHYNIHTGTWFWENGQPMEAALWATGEPTATNMGCYLPFDPYTSGIHDTWLENRYPYACEKPL